MDEVLAMKKYALIDLEKNRSGIWYYLSAIFTGDTLPFVKADQMYKEIELTSLRTKVVSLVREINGIDDADFDNIYIP